MKLDWLRVIVWVVTGQDGGSSVTAWLPVIVGVIGVLGTVTGVAVGGLVSYFVKKTELSHQIKEENRKLKIARLEDLHERIFEFISTLPALTHAFLQVRLSLTASAKELEQIISPSARALIKIESLLMLYAGEFEEEYDDVTEGWQELLNKGSEYVGDKTDSSSLKKTQAELANKCRELQEKVKTKILAEISN